MKLLHRITAIMLAGLIAWGNALPTFAAEQDLPVSGGEALIMEEDESLESQRSSSETVKTAQSDERDSLQQTVVPEPTDSNEQQGAEDLAKQEVSVPSASEKQNPQEQGGAPIQTEEPVAKEFNPDDSDSISPNAAEEQWEIVMEGTDLNAVVAPKTSDYSVTIPAATTLGELSPVHNTAVDYTVSLSGGKDLQGGSIRVTAAATAVLATEQGQKLNSYNSLQWARLTEYSQQSTGRISVMAEDVAAAQEGNYTGTLNFVIEYQGNEQEYNTSQEIGIVSGDTVTGATIYGLDQLAHKQEEAQNTGKHYAFSASELASDSEEAQELAERAGVDAGGADFLDLSLQYKKYSEDGTQLEDNWNRFEYGDNSEEDIVLEVKLDYPLEADGELQVWRLHNDVVTEFEEITENGRPVTDFRDGTYYLDRENGAVYIYTNKFSTWMFKKTEGTTVTPTPIPTVAPTATPKPTTAPTATPVPTVKPTATPGGMLSDGNYTAKVSMRNGTNFSSESMCDPLFYSYADIAVDGDTAKLKLYVIDPIPNYASEGTPLKDVVFIDNAGKQYSATLDTTSDPYYHFDANSAFISSAGNYPTTVITVNVPTQAVSESENQTLKCQAYVDAVMNTTQTFYVVLSDFTSGSTDSEQTPTPTTTPTPTASPLPTASPAPTTTPVPNGTLENGNYTAKASMRNGTNFSSESMCDPLFYNYADIAVDGDTAKLKLYVIDPIPNYASEGTPLRDVVFIDNAGKQYSATLDTTSDPYYHFDANSAFISSAGNYPTTIITVTVPTQAITNSSNQTLKCQAYVNAVMKSTQTFYVVLSDFASGSTTSAQVSATPTPTPSATSGTIEAGNGSFSTQAITSEQLEDGEYRLPVTAVKEASDEASMMADYMLPDADIVVTDGKATLTIYIQHTVAGIEGGGPKYIKYNGIQATKKENALTKDGIDYDSFAFAFDNNTLESPMLMTMYINAMSIEVKARLLLDFESMKPADEYVESSNSNSGANLDENEAGGAISAVGNAAKEISEILFHSSAAIPAAICMVIVLCGAGCAAGYVWYKRRMK